MTEAPLQHDWLSGIHNGGSLQARLTNAHAMFARQCPGVARVGVALFDDALGQVKTYLASPAEANPLRNYQIPLSQARSLSDTVSPGHVRIIDDLGQLRPGAAEHSQKIYELGMRSSYTLPLFEREKLRGFIFIDSRQKNYFQGEVARLVSLFAHLVGQMVLNYQASVRSLVAALRVSIGMLHFRDPETGNHLERMARFAHLIARELVAQGLVELDDEQIDHIYRFAPLHDIGKVGIPDNILLKPDRLDADEWSVMKTHARIGRTIIDQLIDEFDFDTLPNIGLLRDIAELHHERIDGSGYPYGLAGDEVPLAARIVSVSDIFDALTSIRPYKKAWSNQDALQELLAMAERKQADTACVMALQSRMAEIVQIQQRFNDSGQP